MNDNPLQRERDIFEAMLENAGTHLVFLDYDFNFVRVNSAYAEGAGYTREDLIGRNHFELFPNSENEALFNQARETGEPVEFRAKAFEYKNQPWRGTTYWDWKLIPVKNGLGRVDGFVLSLLEVTRQVRSRQSLKKTLTKIRKMNDQLNMARIGAERRAVELAATFRAMAEAVIIYDTEGMVLQANSVALTLFGFDPAGLSRDELIRKLSLRLPNGNLLKMKEFPPSRALQGERVNGDYLHITNAGGQDYTLLVAAAPLIIEGKIIGAVSTWHDVTEREKLHAQLSYEQARLRVLQQIIEFLPDAIFVLDQDRKIIAWNRALEKMTGVAKNEVIGKKDYAYAIPFYGRPRPILIDMFWEDQAEVGKEYNHIEHEGDTYNTEVFIPAFNHGKGAYLEVKATALRDSQGRISGAIASIRDKTREHEMEEESFKAQKIESIGVLAGGIAHDFNNFLAGILANVQLVKMKLNKGLDVDKALNSIEDTIIKAADLTRQLLTFSKGGAPIKKTTLLRDLLHDTTEFTLRGSKSSCLFSLPDILWLAEVDAGQISQVIGNLIINADQAMPNGGLLQLEAENVELFQPANLPLKPGKYVKITIRDQGIGIPKDILKKIFDPYFTTKLKGNGLGLATSYAIINNHNGYIGVESEVGAGTSFYIYLPAVPEGSSPEPATGKIFHAGKGKVLIMDDMETIGNAAGEMLGELGYQVTYAKDGQTAIEMYLREKEEGIPFDAVIMDLTIPGGLGGKDTLAELRKIAPGVKSIVSSGYSNDPIMSNYREYGFDGVVAKPYKIEELSKVLQKVLIADNR